MSFLEKNLAALQSVSPQTAARISAAATPPDFAKIPGTDGADTYARVVTTAQGTKRIEWLGATSMPRASAASIVAGLDVVSNGANGLGLSIGGGFEWLAFAAKLGRAQMIYVYEPDAGFLRMALDICDLSPLLTPCRIVLISGTPAQAADELSTFLDAHRGFEPPAVLHPLASISAERRNQLLAAGEAIVRRAVTERHMLEAQLIQRLGSTLSPSQPSRGCVAMLLTPHYPSERPIQQEATCRAAARIVIDTHDSTSTALRLQALADVGAKGCPVILSDLFRHQLGLLPAQVPVETWIPPTVGPGFWEHLPPIEAFGPHDSIIVHAGRHAQRLQLHGIPAEKIHIHPLRPAPTAAPLTTPATPAWALRHRIALIADLPAIDAATLNVVLPTHQSVFATACDLITEEYLSVHPGMSADLLRRALARANIDHKGNDPTLHEPMLRMIRDVLIPALPLFVLAGTLAAEGITLALLGDWPGIERYLPPALLSDATKIRRISFAVLRPSDWEDVAVLAHLSPDGGVSPIVWDAVAAKVVLASPRHPADRMEGSLATLLTADADYVQAPPQNFIAMLKALLRDAPRREKFASAAVRRLND